MTHLDPGAITGRSAEQIRAAPSRATYVIHNERARGYFNELAIALGRTDLNISTLAACEGLALWRDRKYLPFVVDHAAVDMATPTQIRALRELGVSI